jgi:hypothetical protein
MKRSSVLTIAAAVLLTGAAGGFAQVGGGFDLTWSTIDGGGGTSSGGGFELSGTIGQPDAGPNGGMTGGGYTLTGGFWPGALPACTTFVAADFTQDCRVNEADFLIFVACATGPGSPYDPDDLPTGCDLVPDQDGIIAADFDGDGDVDHDDYGVFQRCISGSAVATPGCEDL